MAVSQQAIGRFDVVLGIRLARTITPELRERELSPAEQRLHELEQCVLPRAMSNDGALAEPI
jgi:hypothetical protein